jgi:acyl phosphate:glycerol-3-phosphate acyltransferase
VSGVDGIGLVASLALGYVIGSLPLGGLVGRMAGLSASSSAAAVWRGAGPGWGLLAIAVDLARGVLPTALALVTFSWGAGFAAGSGATLGTLWPAAGRLPADRSVIVGLGALLVLVPALGLIAVGVVAVRGSMGRRSAAAR